MPTGLGVSFAPPRGIRENDDVAALIDGSPDVTNGEVLAQAQRPWTSQRTFLGFSSGPLPPIAVAAMDLPALPAACKAPLRTSWTLRSWTFEYGRRGEPDTALSKKWGRIPPLDVLTTE
jgi:hypothetical protein